MNGFRAVVGAAVLGFLVTSCGSSVTGSSAPVTRTVTVSPSPATPSRSTSATPAVRPKPATSSLPAKLVGRWQSVDQGSAEDLIELHADGSYLRAMLLMQQRPSGVFSFSI